VGIALADHVIINHTLDQTIADMLAIVAQARRAASL
jgi:hypothetical protein